MSEHDDDAGKVADTVDNLLHAMALPLPDKFHLQALRAARPAARWCSAPSWVTRQRAARIRRRARALDSAYALRV